MKWIRFKHSARRAKTAVSSPNKKWLALAFFVSLFAVGALFFAPKTSAATSRNKLELIGQHCNDLNSITYSFDQFGDDAQCHGDSGWQEVVNESLGCSDSMFYQHDNPTGNNGDGDTQTLWYTKQGDYKDCYNRAKDSLNSLNSNECKSFDENSDTSKKCENIAAKLHNALGCNNDMFDSANDKEKLSQSAWNDCQDRVNDVGNVHIVLIGQDGKPYKNSDPISSPNVSSTNPNDGGNGGDGQELTCDVAANSPLTWVVCPVVDMMVLAISKTDNLITDQLSIKTSNIFCTQASATDDSCQAYYTAWSTFRNLALGMLVVAGLVIIIAQAVGAEILDAYTIRKTLPRLLVAAVAITLSWPLMNFAVTLSNNLGFGIRDLIIAPFHSFASSINVTFTDSWTDALIGGGLAAGAIPAWIAFGGLGVLLSYVATAGLAVLIAMLVLIIRQIVIVMLILLSPLALLAYVLPNTQRAFRLWWEAFMRALIMFPMIAAFIAVGRVVAAISLQNGGIIQGIIAFIAYFGPYFMIPLTFQFSGSIMGGVGNFIQSRGQGVAGGISNYRKGQRENRVARARTQGLYRQNFGKYKLRPGGKQRSLGGSLNNVGYWGLNADEMLPWKLGTTKVGKAIDGKKGIPGFRRGGQELESEIKRATRDQTVQAAQDLDIGYKSGRLMGGQLGYFTDALDSDGQQALDKKFGIKNSKTGLVDHYRAPDNWGERMELADIVGSAQDGDMNTEKGREQTAKAIEAREAAGELRATASEFEKYTKSPETNRVDGKFLGMLSAAKAGRLEIGDVVNHHNDLVGTDQETANRHTTMLQDALTAKRVSSARGHGIWYSSDGKAHSAYEDPTSPKAQSSLMRINSQELSGGKSEDIDALEETLVAGAAPFKTKFNAATKKVEPVVDPKTGAWTRHDPNTLEGQRAKEVQGRIKTIAMYNSGDSDVGVKIKKIWVNRLGLNPNELEWGSGRHSTDPREVEMAMGKTGGGADPGASGAQPGQPG